ncbi:MAG: tetratricopeptide repeat protein [Promethearchaeota archaeon]
MSNSVSKELANAKNLINEGKFENALQLVNDIEEKENLNHEETLRTQAHKGRIYIDLGQNELALKNAEDLYQKSKTNKMPLFSLQALFLKALINLRLARFEEFFKNLEEYEKLFKSIPREDSLEFQERKAELLFAKGLEDHINSNFDRALDYFNKGLTLFERIEPRSPYIYKILTFMAYSYLEKGALKLALEFDEKALAKIPNGEYYTQLMFKIHIYRNMGIISYEKGDLDGALDYYMDCLEIHEKIKGGEFFLNIIYGNIMTVLYAKKDFTQAQNYLQKIKQLNESSPLNPNYLLIRALVLSTSSRMRDRAEAEAILKEIPKENPSIRVTNSALIGLCNLYFEEYRIFNQMEILEDIQPLIDHLQRNARDSNSYSLLANMKLIQAKLALLQINMVDARKLLTEAQNIADKHGLQLLAGEISREHDRLLEELKLWESIKKTQASASERLELASVDPVIERLQGRRALEPLESSGQQPVSLLILAAGGVLLFSYPFSDEWKQDADLFGSFLSAFSTFSDEFFSQGLDRAKFGEETILLQSV